MTTPGASGLLAGLARRAINLAAPYAQQIVQASMTSTVQIARNVRPVWDSVAKTTTTGPGSIIYVGIANLTIDARSSEIVLGDAPLRIGSLTASIPISAQMPQVDDLLTVLTAADPQLLAAGNGFRVTSVSRGGAVPTQRTMELEVLEASTARSLTPTTGLA